jgi:hypothetical protein
MNLINTQQGIINSCLKELNARMRAIPTYIHIEGLHEDKSKLDNAWFFYHSNTQTAWNRFKSYIPFTLQNTLKGIYWTRAKTVKEKLTILDRSITAIEQKPKPVSHRSSAPDLPRIYPELFVGLSKQRSNSVSDLPRLSFKKS